MDKERLHFSLAFIFQSAEHQPYPNRVIIISIRSETTFASTRECNDQVV